MGLIDKARRRRYRARLVLWGGRRYDFQLGSRRDVIRCETFQQFAERYVKVASVWRFSHE